MLELKKIELPILKKDDRVNEQTDYLAKVTRYRDKDKTEKLYTQLEVGVFHKTKNHIWVLVSDPHFLGKDKIEELYEIIEDKGAGELEHKVREKAEAAIKGDPLLLK